MTRTHKSRFTRTVLSASIAAIGLAAAPLALANGEVEIGLGNVSRSSGTFGNYNGLNDSGGYGIAGIQMLRRNDTRYFEIEGRNLGLKSRSLSIGGGEQGNFGLKFDYIEIPKIESDSYQTPYLGAGTTRLTQPATVTDAATTAAMTGLAASMRPYEVGTDRKILGLGLTKVLAGGWDLAFNVKRDTKDGTKLRGAIIQIGTGGSRGVVIVPEVVDYNTDMVEAMARYDGGKLQLQFGYYGSFFTNGQNAMTWDNLYTGTGNTTGRYALAPDNQFHQLNASGGYVISPATRISGNLSLGRMTQNEAFVPYSTAGVLPATTSLNGKVNTTHASLKLTSRLMPTLNLTAGYKYDQRDNKTPVNQYDYVTGDREASIPADYSTSSFRRRNTPTSSTSHKAYADLDYRLAKATKLKVGYDYHKVTHTYEPTTQDVEHTVKAEVKHKFSDATSGGLAYSYSDRNADTYLGHAPLAATYAPGYLATLISAGVKSYPWLEAPPLRKYFLDDRRRDKVRVYANFAPTDTLDLHFGLDYRQDKHPEADAGFGLSKVNSWAANFDASQRFSGAVSGHVFATLEEYSTDQKGANLSNANSLSAETNTTAESSRWKVSIRDRIFTMGLGLRVKPGGKFEYGGDLVHASSNGATSFAAGSAVTVGPLPDLISRRNRLELFGRYEVQKDLSVRLQYIYERYHSTDWGYDSPLTLTSVSTVVGTNQVSPKYNVHAIGISALYKFK